MHIRYLLVILIVLTVQASAVNIPVSQAKIHIEQQIGEFIKKESINLEQLPTPVSIALNQRINNLFSRIKKSKNDTISEEKLTIMINNLVTDFAKQSKASVSSKGLEAAVNKAIDQAFAEADLSPTTIPQIMKAEFRSKKEYVIAMLGKKLAETPTITLSDVSILIHTVFDSFIERIEYFQISEVGKIIVASIDLSKKPNCSQITIPSALKEKLKMLVQ